MAIYFYIIVFGRCTCFILVTHLNKEFKIILSQDTHTHTYPHICILSERKRPNSFFSIKYEFSKVDRYKSIEDIY